MDTRRKVLLGILGVFALVLALNVTGVIALGELI